MRDYENPEIYSAQPLSTEEHREGAMSLQQLATTGKLVLRGNPGDISFTSATSKLLGSSLPTAANTAVAAEYCSVMWRGPDEWLVVLPLERLRSLAANLEVALEGQLVSVVDVTDAYSVIRLSGRNARDVISSGCSLNMNKAEFGAGHCAQSHFYKAGIILRFVDETPTFDVFVRRSETEYLWKLLKLACQSNA